MKKVRALETYGSQEVHESYTSWLNTLILDSTCTIFSVLVFYSTCCRKLLEDSGYKCDKITFTFLLK
jgi:hypothetical protein